MPPAKIMILPLLEAWIPKNCPPDWLWAARSLVAMSKARAVVGHAHVRNQIAASVGDRDVGRDLLLGGVDCPPGVTQS
ncbi:MAG TPA: hypothetical protein VKG25_16475 [Bryobacteraceae bacterium]|nr:hypothetical protein [Bryobacteraceae bacterium]